jgi:hypothetical protein
MSSVKAIVLATVLLFSGFSPAYVNPARHFHSEQEAKAALPERYGCMGQHENRGLSFQGRTVVWSN